MLNIPVLTHSLTMLNIRIIKDLTADVSLEMELGFFFNVKRHRVVYLLLLAIITDT